MSNTSNYELQRASLGTPAPEGLATNRTTQGHALTKEEAARLQEEATIGNKSVFFECQDIWDSIKEHPYLIVNPGIHGSAQACFDIRNLEKLRGIKEHVELSYELTKLQENENDGRGVSCVRQVAAEILWGDYKGAKTIAHTDWDKIRNYPEIAQWLKNKGFAEQDW